MFDETPRSDAMHEKMQELASETLVTHMSKLLNLPVTRDSYGLRLPKIDALFSVRVHDIVPQGDAFASFVFLDVEFGLGQSVSELMMGAAHTPEEAVTFAVHDLTESVAAPMVMMCFSDMNLPGCSTMEITDGHSEWFVIEGPVLNNDYSGQISKFFETTTPFKMVLQRMKEPFAPNQLHWIKCYAAEMGGQMVREVRLDNEPVEQFESSLPTATTVGVNPMMYRQFAIMAPAAWVG